MGSPLVSIITPSFNQVRFLPDTLRSVREQAYRPIEHIVVDGGSTDGSVEVLRATAGIRWVSEPDRGPVDALNKGFALAQGQVLAWLNSDDLFYPDTVGSAVRALRDTGADMVYGDVDMVDEECRRVLKVCRGIPFELATLLHGLDYIGQQTAFFRRDLLARAGPPREDYQNSYDYELWIRFARHGTLCYRRGLRAQIRLHPAARSIAQRAVTLRENERLRDECWQLGGWPEFWRHQPWRHALHYGYRLRRQLIARLGPTLAPS
ncbi:glycosyltransferase [bacterium]|nr:glycosyltransferase [bacterium]